MVRSLALLILPGTDHDLRVQQRVELLMQVLRFMAAASVSLRKWSQPAIKGIRSVSNSLDTFHSCSTYRAAGALLT